MPDNIDHKQFLNTHNSWYKKYSPLINDLLRAYKTQYPTKPCPSLDLMLAFITQESGGNPWAVRLEPAFQAWLEGRIKEQPTILKTYGPVTRQTEICMRSTSFGLQQIMGQTLRELGFERTYLTEACDPQVSISFGIKFISKLMEKYSTEDAVISAYNAGSPRRLANGKYSNQPYVDSVKAHKERWAYIIGKGW